MSSHHDLVMILINLLKSIVSKIFERINKQSYVFDIVELHNAIENWSIT